MLTKIKVWLLLWVFKTVNGFFKVSVKTLYAQIVHETANFTSSVYRENNNLFGMREAKTRKKTSTGTNKGHAVYKNHIKSIIDYFLRQKYFGISNTHDDEYMKATAKSNYATDPLYMSKWKAVKLKYSDSFFGKLIMYGGLFFFISSMYFLCDSSNL